MGDLGRLIKHIHLTGLAAGLTLFSGLGWTADEELIVTAPATLVETELLDYGPVKINYRARSTGPAYTFDQVSFLGKSRQVPAARPGFGVRLHVRTRPRRVIDVAEVWSHPALVNAETGASKTSTVWIHTIDPPDIFEFYFPLDEYPQAPAGEWKLDLYLVSHDGPVATNVALTDEASQYSAPGRKPFFSQTFQVESH